MAIQIETSNLPMLAQPTSLEEAGLDLQLVLELALKFLYAHGTQTARELVEALCLPFAGLLERALSQAKREELVEITGSNGIGELGYRYALTSKGH